MLLMIKGQARPFSFAGGNSTLSNPDSVLRELETPLNWGTSVCHENLPFFFSFLTPFRALTCRWSSLQKPQPLSYCTENIQHGQDEAQGENSLRDFFMTVEMCPHCSERLALAPLQSSWHCKLQPWEQFSSRQWMRSAVWCKSPQRGAQQVLPSALLYRVLG